MSASVKRKWLGIFLQKGIPKPQASVEILWQMGVSKLPAQEQIPEFEKLCAMREINLPLPYCIGRWSFYKMQLAVQKPILIPRIETERLVKEVLIAESHNDAKRFLDVGVGCGAIALSILNERPSFQATGVDILPEAIKLTSENASTHGLRDRIHLWEGDLRDYPSDKLFDFLVCNPSRTETKLLKDKISQDEAQHTHDASFNGGSNGLDMIRMVLECSKALVTPGGSIWLELDAHQVEQRFWEPFSDFIEIKRSFSETSWNSDSTVWFCELKRK